VTRTLAVMCDPCKREMIAILEARMRRIMDVAYNVPECSEADVEIADAKCFHLMELRQILEGKQTCGVYDDHGEPPTIKGPLFQEQRP